MSNKSNGTAFEKEFAQQLYEHGFWAHLMQDNQNGQPFDVIAARNGHTYVFDCKDCRDGVFKLSRIEENQHDAMKLWAETGNKPGLFAIRMNNAIYLMPHRMLEIMHENGARQVKEEELMKYSRRMESWLTARNRLDKRVI